MKNTTPRGPQRNRFRTDIAPTTVVLIGSIGTTLAAGTVDFPAASLLLLPLPLLLVTIGLSTFSRQITHPAPLYAVLAHGSGRVVGVGGAMVALVAYNAIQVSFYGLLGAVITRVFAGTWWLWALGAWAAVGVLGVRGSTPRVLAAVLASGALGVAAGGAVAVDTVRAPDVRLLIGSVGPLVFALGLAVLVISVFAAMLSFHKMAARYVYGLAREGVLPSPWRAVRGGVPVGGSITQSSVALIVIAVCAVVGADPITSMFTPLAALSALSMLVLMVAASAAVIAYFWRQDDRPTRWSWLTAPALGGSTLAAAATLNISTLSGAVLPPWILPAVVAAAAGGGLAWGAALRSARPGVYAAIGRGQPKPLAVPDRALAPLEM